MCIRDREIKRYCYDNNKNIEVYDGITGLNKIATLKEIDIVVTSVVGMIGLEPTIKACLLYTSPSCSI